jgi:hypothetical protein
MDNREGGLVIADNCLFDVRSNTFINNFGGAVSIFGGSVSFRFTTIRTFLFPFLFRFIAAP